MNILHVNTVSHIGGAAKVMSRLLFKQREKGHTVSILIDGTHTLPMPISGTDSCPRTAQGILNHPYVQKADVIHLHNLHGGDYFDLNVLPELTLRKKVIWTLHDMWPLTGHCCHALDCTEWITGCKKCTHWDYNERIDDDCASAKFNHKHHNYIRSRMTVTAPSQWLCNLIKQGVLNKFPCFCVPNALDTDIFRPMDKQECKKRLGLPLDKLIVGCSANGGVLDNSYKGGHYVLDVIRHLSDLDVVFANFGSTKTVRDGNIWNFAHVDDEQELATRYSALDLALHTPIAETFGLILVEFAACGVPTVGFDVGGMPEQIVDGKTGFVIPNRDCAQAAEAIRVLNSDRGLLRNFGFAAREFVVQNFGLELQYQQYLKLYLN